MEQQSLGIREICITCWKAEEAKILLLYLIGVAPLMLTKGYGRCLETSEKCPFRPFVYISKVVVFQEQLLVIKD